MKTTRLLLPFTHGVHTLALEYGVMFAKSCNATLVPVSLLPVSKESRGPRLEHIQQSQDFLVAVQHKAARHSVPTEPVELFTSDVVGSIKAALRDMHCDGILLFMRDGDGILLHVNEVEHVMTGVASKRHIIHLPSNKKANSAQALFKRLSGFLAGQAKSQAVSKVGLS